MSLKKYEQHSIAELQHILAALMYAKYFILRGSPIIDKMIEECSIALNHAIFREENREV